MNEETKQKPLIIELEDAKTEFVQFIKSLQDRGLSCYLIEMALAGTWAQIGSVAKMELDMAKTQMKE